MKNNLYTKSVENIKAPKNLIEKSINNIYGAALNNEVNIMKK